MADKKLYDENYNRKNIVQKKINFNRKNKEDVELLAYVESQGNFSRFTKLLYRQHMEKK